jgi:hypothetical protein
LLVIETESRSVSVRIATGSELSEVRSEVFTNDGSGFFAPIRFSFTDRQNIQCSLSLLKRDLSEFQISQLPGRVGELLSKLRMEVRNFPRSIPFDGTTVLLGANREITVLVSHESTLQLDLSFTLIKTNGSLGASCFFNSPSIEDAIRLGNPQKVNCQAIGHLKLGAVQKTVHHVTMSLTYSAEGFLSQFGSVCVRLLSGDDLLLELPLRFGDCKGVFVGTFERVTETEWKFVFFGIESTSSLPPTIAKVARKAVLPKEEEFDWVST